MIEHKPIAGEFNHKAEVELHRQFTTPESREAARETHTHAEKLLGQAQAYLNKNLAKKTEQLGLDYTPPDISTRRELARRENARQEHSRFMRRSDRILKARDNQLKRIEQRQPRQERGSQENQKLERTRGGPDASIRANAVKHVDAEFMRSQQNLKRDHLRQEKSQLARIKARLGPDDRQERLQGFKQGVNQRARDAFSHHLKGSRAENRDVRQQQTAIHSATRELKVEATLQARQAAEQQQQQQPLKPEGHVRSIRS
jgi:hypothetical protein